MLVLHQGEKKVFKKKVRCWELPLARQAGPASFQEYNKCLRESGHPGEN